MTESPSFFDRDRALQLLEQVRAALTNDNFQEAAQQVDALQNLLGDWRRSHARAWLDATLITDVLLFDVEAANGRLDEWQKAAPDDEKEQEQLEQYRERVRQRTRQKQVELQVRGVTAYCEGLWRQATELERGEEPPRPDFILENYFTKARDAARTTHAEHPGNAELDVLFQRAQRLLQNKIIAGKVYKMAIEEDRYGSALDELDKLDTADLVPRYRVVVDPTSEMLAFDRMVSITDARDELKRLGRAWASDQANEMTSLAESHLEAYDPQAALDALANRQRVERFIDETTRQKLRELEQQANEDSRALEQAERRARQALHLAEENPMGAWDVYVEAHQIYAGAPALKEAHQGIVRELTAQLEQLSAEAEDAFTNKDMKHARQLCQKARLDYGDKDASLAAVLGRFEELDWQAQSYLEYLQNASALLEQLRELVWQDLNAAAEMLTQLEDYPDIVLEELPDLDEVRAALRQRIKVEAIYKEIAGLISSGDLDEVEQGVATAEEYGGEDARFQRLAAGLKTHALYLSARQAQEEGRLADALSFLEQVADSEGHPDQKAARRLATQIQDELPKDDALGEE